MRLAAEKNSAAGISRFQQTVTLALNIFHGLILSQWSVSAANGCYAGYTPMYDVVSGNAGGREMLRQARQARQERHEEK
jgi:hypothetical protein